MLELKGIKKDYPAGSGVVHALKGIDLKFRRSEFVSVLGPSGCGKTTMLNIIGGLDGYTDGDLVINGISTKKYKDRDWDAYRNHSIGFVFQTYNLISHQTVLQNVELALTLVGVSKAERRARAKQALEEVGLGDQLKKKPGEMSGGQMQRVAIARALVNNPDIILADEPTGALDTETSVQVMEILKKISKDRLIIMVTHNPELAETYSSRIIKMLDGVIISDSSPLTEAECRAEEESRLSFEREGKKAKRVKKPSMSFGTSFMLSLKNLFTKKGRTTLTAFAGSIGIIGIALILAVSQGTTAYINQVQESTLSAYPLTLESSTIDMSALMQSFMNQGGELTHDTDALYKDPIIGELVEALSRIEENENDLAAFKSYLEGKVQQRGATLDEALSGIQYTYDITPTVYTKNLDGKIIKSDTQELMAQMLSDFMLQMSTGSSTSSTDGALSSMSNPMMSSMMGVTLWQEMLPGLNNGGPINELLYKQYDVIYGDWPNEMDEIVIVVNERNELDDLTLYALGLLSEAEIDAIISAAASGQTLPEDNKKWSYEEICDLTFKVIFPYDCYTESNGVFIDISKNDNMLAMLYEDALELRVVGIIRQREDADTAMLTGSIGYTHLLTEHIIKQASSSEVVKAQLSNPNTDVFTGLPFRSGVGVLPDSKKADAFRYYAYGLSTDEKAELYVAIQCIIAQRLQLDGRVDEILYSMQDKDMIIMQISAAISEQMGIDPGTVSAQLSELTIEQLREMLRPSIEEQIAAGIEEQVRAGFAYVSNDQKAAMLDAELSGYGDDECIDYYDRLTVFSSATYEENLAAIGAVDIDSPKTINLYAASFEDKDVIIDTIAKYNSSVPDDKKITYTDYIGIMMSSITTIINAITYVLIAFVAISLVVSSIMIGVITLISVQERTKEIGILRAIGASKKDVSGMFNAETIIIGLCSGLIGVGVTYLLCIPINLILYHFTGISNLRAELPVGAAVILVAISVILTLFSGIIPSRSAAKKDPVVALRSE